MRPFRVPKVFRLRPRELAIASALALSMAAPGLMSGIAAASPNGGETLGDVGTCQLAQIAFCDTFSTPSPGGRGGDLNDANWSFARIAKSAVPSIGHLDMVQPTDAMFCRTPQTGLMPDHDSFFCNADGMEMMHWMTAQNDGGDYNWFAARVRQPFDFANRTGNVVFDVDNKVETRIWTELWITDQPIPDPIDATQEAASQPRNGIALSFLDTCGQADHGGLGSVMVFNNYKATAIPVQQQCYQTMMDGFNHFDLEISQSSVQVWASDPSSDHGMTFPNYRLVASATGLNLPFTRGYVSLQQNDVNSPDTPQTYHWHNVGFDGPVLPVERGYEVPDALTPVNQPNHPNALNVGYMITDPTKPQTFYTGAHGYVPVRGMYTCCQTDGSPTSVPSLPLNGVDLSNAASATLTFNTRYDASSATFHYRFNGGAWHDYTDPYTGGLGGWRALAIPVALSDLRSGDNGLEISATTPSGQSTGLYTIANIDLSIATSGSSTAPAPGPGIHVTTGGTSTTTTSISTSMNMGSSSTTMSSTMSMTSSADPATYPVTVVIPERIVIAGMTTTTSVTATLACTLDQSKNPPISCSSQPVSIALP